MPRYFAYPRRLRIVTDLFLNFRFPSAAQGRYESSCADDKPPERNTRYDHDERSHHHDRSRRRCLDQEGQHQDGRRQGPESAEGAKKSPGKPATKKAAKPAEEKVSRQGRANSKKMAVLDLLRRKDGATLAEIAKATGWQNQSIRGFISGTIPKKMGLTIAEGASKSLSALRKAATDQIELLDLAQHHPIPQITLRCALQEYFFGVKNVPVSFRTDPVIDISWDDIRGAQLSSPILIPAFDRRQSLLKCISGLDSKDVPIKRMYFRWTASARGAAFDKRGAALWISRAAETLEMRNDKRGDFIVKTTPSVLSQKFAYKSALSS